jgi:hypothetical protein
MKTKSNWIELSAVCGLFILLSIWGIVWDISSGLLTSGIDGIMLLFICLMMGGIFSLMLVVMLWQAGLIPVFKKTEGKAETSPPRLLLLHRLLPQPVQPQPHRLLRQRQHRKRHSRFSPRRPRNNSEPCVRLR